VIEVFVNLSDYLGAPLDVLLKESTLGDPLLVTDQSSGLASSRFQIEAATGATLSSVQWDILRYLRTQRENPTQSTDSVVTTDRVVAYNDVISPQVITDLLVAKTIRADRIEGMEIFTNRLETLSTLIAAQQSASSSANPVFSDSNEKSLNSLTVLDLLKVGKGLQVLGNATFLGTTLFSGSATFAGDVTYISSPLSASDSAGTALIKTGAAQVTVSFSKTYPTTPIVQATLVSAPDSDESAEELLLSQDIGFLVTKRTASGFTIRLQKPAPLDLLFGWTAMFAPARAPSVGENKTATPVPVMTQPTPSPTPSTEPPLPPTQATPSASPRSDETI
jgi:hypothetical protein